ncbi:hypothetical protein AB0Y39_07760, partial [Weissella paramesenteroides]|uniref:hypothetical protein n=1 Tax=Weissella paramesenteroides TaxID=1249 RepID=UPI003F203D6C
ESAKPAETVLTCCFSGSLFVLMNNPGLIYYNLNNLRTLPMIKIKAIIICIKQKSYQVEIPTGLFD